MRRAHRLPITWQQVFVVGAPRSGTTVLHALVCSAPTVNEYVAECTYFTQMLQPLLRIWPSFDVHAQSYFADRKELAHYHGDLLASVLYDTWEHLGRPPTLALKDPMLTAQLELLGMLLPEARFVVSVRDPRDVVASWLAVVARKGGEVESADAARRIAQEYRRDYEAVLRRHRKRPDAVFLVPYQQLVQGGATASLERYLGVTLDPNQLWQGWSANDAMRQDPTFSANYGRPLSAASVGRWTERLTAEQVRVVEEICGPVAAALGYPLGPA